MLDGVDGGGGCGRTLPGPGRGDTPRRRASRRRTDRHGEPARKAAAAGRGRGGSAPANWRIAAAGSGRRRRVTGRQHEVVAVAHHDHDALAGLLAECEGRLDQGLPQMRLASDTQVELVVEIREQRVPVRREARSEDDAIGEAADLRAILGQHAQHEVPRALEGAIEFLDHAARSVDQHDRAERLDGNRELRDRLFAPLVVELEVVLREIEHEAAIPVAHGRIDGHDVGAGAELRLLGWRARGRSLEASDTVGPADNDENGQEQNAGTDAGFRSDGHGSSPGTGRDILSPRRPSRRKERPPRTHFFPGRIRFPLPRLVGLE